MQALGGSFVLLAVVLAGCDNGEETSPTASPTTAVSETPDAGTPTTTTPAATMPGEGSDARAGTADDLQYARVSDNVLGEVAEQTDAEAGPPRGYSFTWFDVAAAPFVGETVHAEMEAIRADFEEELGAPSPDAPISQDVTITAELIAASGDAIGVRLEIFKFYGANGAVEARTLWFDRSAGTALPATALLDGEDGLAQVADLVREALARDRPDLGAPDTLAGTEPTEGHFDAIGFTAEGDLLVELDEGQVGAMASGSPRVVISADAADSLLSDYGRAAQRAAREAS